MRLIYPLGFLLLLLAAACEVDRDFVTGDAVQLRFSVDTLTFDTVFTARGSATRQFKVYNDGSDPVRIDRISVAGETGVNFTFNADGEPGPVAEEVVIFGRDSIFVFVEVEVDPSVPETISPFIAEDRIIFESGDRRESVVLEAFGQNANYLNGFRRGSFFQPICQDGTFTLPTDLPTVIYGSMFVDSCTLRVLAGSRIYFHGGLQRNPAIGGNGIFNDGFIYTLPDGRIEIEGTSDNPVLLASDRLEEGFLESRGAYRGLILGPGSRGNRIEHAEIRNTIIGVTVDSLAEVVIENTRITNSSSAGVYTYQGDATLRNTLLHSNYGSSLTAGKGGNLTMEHVTLANYGDTTAALVLSNVARDPATREDLFAPLRARIRNSVIAGPGSRELLLSDSFQRENAAAFDLEISNTVVRPGATFLTEDGGRYADFYSTICQACYPLEPGDLLFLNPGDDDYRLDSLSVARDLGTFLPELPMDLNGNQRDTDTPDAGALEWQPGQ